MFDVWPALSFASAANYEKTRDLWPFNRPDLVCIVMFDSFKLSHTHTETMQRLLLLLLKRDVVDVDPVVCVWSASPIGFTLLFW